MTAPKPETVEAMEAARLHVAIPVGGRDSIEALVLPVEAAAAVADRLVAEAVRAERRRWREWFAAIAEDDDLVEANPEAFSVHALRRRQDQARNALDAMDALDPPGSDGTDDGPVAFALARSLLGKGRLLRICEGGEIAIETDDGFVSYCWPMLDIEALDEEGGQ